MLVLYKFKERKAEISKVVLQNFKRHKELKLYTKKLYIYIQDIKPNGLSYNFSHELDKKYIIAFGDTVQGLKAKYPEEFI